MELYFESERTGLTERFGFDARALAALVAEAALVREGCPFDAEISVTVVDDEAIRGINREMRGIDAATDVLSFPMLEFQRPGDFSGIGEGEADCFDLDTGRLLLGDVVISADHVLAQAREYGHSVKREFAFLMAHSMLHLCGYDHMTEEEAEVMYGRQEELLTELGITRDPVQ